MDIVLILGSVLGVCVGILSCVVGNTIAYGILNNRKGGK